MKAFIYSKIYNILLAIKKIKMSANLIPAFAILIKKSQLLFQSSIFIGLFIFIDFLVKKLNLPLPANIIGMVIMFLFISFKIIPIKAIAAGSKWILTNMLLFFIPAIVAILNYKEILLSLGWKIILILLISTILTFTFTSLIVDQIYRFELKRYLHKKNKKSKHHKYE